MGARLEWNGERLMLGGMDGWTLGAVRKESGKWRPVLNRMVDNPSRYDLITDAMQALEAEVRRLLCEAGVDVEN